MVDNPAGKGNSRRTDSGNDEKHDKRRVTVDVASRNQTNTGKYKPYTYIQCTASELIHIHMRLSRTRTAERTRRQTTTL